MQGRGTILATTNGAATWTRQTPASITHLKPASGKRGALVTIMGRGLGVAKAGNSVQFGTETRTACISWSDARMKCVVPGRRRPVR